MDTKRSKNLLKDEFYDEIWDALGSSSELSDNSEELDSTSDESEKSDIFEGEPYESEGETSSSGSEFKESGLESNSEDEFIYYSSESDSSDTEDPTSDVDTGQNTQTNTDAPSDTQWADADDQPDLPTFAEHCGVTAAVDDKSSEFDCFSMFFDKEMISKIMIETNRYATTRINQMKLQNTLKPNSYWNKWTPVNLQEMYYFFALVLFMCVSRRPGLRYYWSNCPTMKTLFARRLLSRRRFCSVLYMLCLDASNLGVESSKESQDPEHKLRSFLDLFIQKCKSYYSPSENLTINDVTCVFGRRMGLGYKASKFDMKLHVLCDSETGYVLNCEIGQISESERISPENVVQILCSSYLGKGHTLYMNQYYASPRLFTALWKHRTLAVGMVKKNRKGLPPSFKKLKLKQGEAVFKRKEHLLALKWRDTLGVATCLSTKNRAALRTVSTTIKGKTMKKTKPCAIMDYKINKSGVRSYNLLQEYYSFQNEKLKLWKAIFFHLILMGVLNSYIIHSRASGKDVQFYKFIMSLVYQLIKKGRSFNETARASTSGNESRIRHLPYVDEDTAAQPCRVCTGRGDEYTERFETEDKAYCKDCDVVLCIVPCFEDFHTKEEYQ